MNSVKQGAKLPYTMGFLMKRYQIRQQSLNEYIKKHIDEINQDGIHARKVGKEWRFDGTAIRIIDELRDFAGDSVVMNGYETAEELKIKELERLLAGFKDKIDELEISLESREATIRIQADLIATTKEQNARLIGEKDKLLLLTSQAEAEKQAQTERIESLEAENALVAERARLVEAELARERSKGFWEKVKDLFG